MLIAWFPFMFGFLSTSLSS